MMGVFSPDSAIWHITRERVILLGGPAAVVLQVAHPKVAMGVAAHSDFRNNASRRLIRTLDAVYSIAFGTRTEADATAARVRAVHSVVRGPGYSALDEDALLWVLATLIQLSVDTFTRFVHPLSGEECEAFLRDMRVFGKYFGVDEGYGPQDWPAFRAYFDGMVAGPLLGSLALSAELARHIVRPRRPLAFRVLAPWIGMLAGEFLPSPLREKLGLRAPPRVVAGCLGVLPLALRCLPASVRFAPQYRRALTRQY